MKKYFLICTLALIGLTTLAQGKFNGTVNYEISYKGEQVEMLSFMMPNKQVYHYLDGNFRMETLGGVASGQGDLLYLAKTDKTYLISDSDKKAQEMPENDDDATTKDKMEVTVTKTNETATVLDYTCTKYKVIIKTNDGEITQYIWATTQLTPVKPKNVGKMGAMAAIFEGVEGMPLKVEMELNQMGLKFSMVLTATNIIKNAPDKSMFVIPAGYTVEPYKPMSIGR